MNDKNTFWFKWNVFFERNWNKKTSIIFINLKFFFVAMVNKNILKIRKELDKLDNILLNIIKRRTKLVDRVIQNKKYKKDIVDKKRMKIILSNISKKSNKNKIDPKITNKIWRSMIKAFIEYEFRNFKRK